MAIFNLYRTMAASLLHISIFMAAALPAQANASAQTGKIIYLTVRASDGLVYFELDGARGSRPACAKYGYFMIANESSYAGKQQYAMLLSAKMASKTIEVSGTNQCVRWGDGEDVDAIRVLE